MGATWGRAHPLLPLDRRHRAGTRWAAAARSGLRPHPAVSLGWRNGRTHPRHGRHARRRPRSSSRRRRPSASRFPVRATVFREGHDRLAAEVVLTAPDGTKRPPVRMTKHESIPDRYDAWVTPDVAGAWTFEIQAWSDPVATWEHNAGLKIPAGVDVDLMFEEGKLLCEKVLAAGGRRQRRGQAAPGRDRGRGRPRPPARRPARGPAGPRAGRGDGGAPDPRAGHDRGPLPGVRRPAAGAVRQLVRVLPALRGRHPRRRRQGRQRHLPDRGQAARRGGGDGLRRHLPAADPPDRRGQPQGPQQHAHARPRRPGLTVGDRLQGRRPRRRPPRPRHPRGLRRVRRARQRASASRSRSTSRSRPRPTTRGSRATRSSSPRGSTAPSPTPRTRRRSTRTSTR